VSFRFDCGKAESPVAEGYRKLTADDLYSGNVGYGWETTSALSVVFDGPTASKDPMAKGSYGQEVMLPLFKWHRNDLNADGVICKRDLVFRADLPNGLYRVSMTVGDWSEAVSSIDVRVNSELVEEQVSAWRPASYRMFGQSAFGWPTTIRTVVKVKDRKMRIALSKNQSFYDEQMAKQAKMENPYKANWYHSKPVVRKPPYFYIGRPFSHNSLMAIEITPYIKPAIQGIEDDQIKLNVKQASSALKDAVAKFNAKDFAGVREALKKIEEPTARAILTLWLVGRLEVEKEQPLIEKAIKDLKAYCKANPDDYVVGDMLTDAEIFHKALVMHLTRGEEGKGHFVENDKAIAWWLLILEGSPLYYKSQLYIARAGHMLKPYMPTLGTERQIFEKLEKKFPDNRYVKYHLHEEWEPYGDGNDKFDWVMKDYFPVCKDAPEWVRAIYPLYMGNVDLAEWWIRYRQEPAGSIGGGWGDDVEMVGLFGYYGYIARGVSEMCTQGTRNLINGLWYNSGVDPEMGFLQGMGDAEHSTEHTGNTLGMMMQIDYGNPEWIEASMKTGKLIRDLWTDYNNKGHRHFRANFLGGAQVGKGDQMNDSAINLRGISPASSVLWYNQNPAISELIVEMADGWVAAAMSTDRGKPKGVIPAEISFPEGIIGGVNSPNWWTASHPSGTVNHDWWDDKWNKGQAYKGGTQKLLMDAYKQTGNFKYLEPLKLEYELATKFGRVIGTKKKEKKPAKGDPGFDAEPGSEEWVACRLKLAGAWYKAEELIKGREGEIRTLRTKEEIIEKGFWGQKCLKRGWPLLTTEAGPTDRVAYDGIITPFFVYTGGGFGGPLLKSAVTYENTTEDFAAAVLAADLQGLRIIYYSMAPDTRKVGIVPWEFEPGAKYRLRYGVDRDGDGTIDDLAEDRVIDFPQVGTVIHLNIEPRKEYFIELEMTERGRAGDLASDPGLSSKDIRYAEKRGLILARIHNVGSASVRNVEVAFYDGDPQKGGVKIGQEYIPNLEAPVDLEPRTVNVAIHHPLKGKPREIYVVIDPDDRIKNEITTFNNVASAKLPGKKEANTAPKKEISLKSSR